MKITGSYTIDAPREEVWAALNDIDVLARIVPGCERLEQVGDNEFEGRVKIGIQAIKGTYSGKIRLEDIQPPHHYKLVASGRSASGVVDGAGLVDLAEQDGKTVLTYTGDAQIGGTLASVGQRLIEGASKQMINQSLKALVEQIRQRASQGAEPPDTAQNNPSASSPSTPSTSSGTSSGTGGASSNGIGSSPAAAAPAATTAASTAIAAEDEQARPPAAVSAAVTTETPDAPPRPAEWRTVVVPDHEQLKPESVVRGVVDDLLAERPWLPWVILAFLLGYLIGRSRR